MPKTRAVRSAKSVNAPAPEPVFKRSPDLRPTYANWVQMGATDNEFRLSFGEIVESSPERIETCEWARVYMAPRMAKLLLGLLVNAVTKHEEMHGEISLVRGRPSGVKLPS